MSISAERIHLAASGRAAQEKAGPKAPSPGPTLPMADMTVLMDSVSPTPQPINNIHPTKMQIKYVTKNVYTVAEVCTGTQMPFTRTGKTARV